MAIDSVSSAVSSTVQAPPQNRETQRTGNRGSETEARVQRDESRRVEQREASQSRPETAAARRPDEAEQRPPVVNGQGQVTGTRINTTA